jgi:hypothetical protein
MKPRYLLCTLALAALACRPALAQQPADDTAQPAIPAMPAMPTAPPTVDTPAAITDALHTAENSNDGAALVYAYGAAAADPHLAQAALTQLMTDYYRLRGQAQTAEQATQAIEEATLRFAVLQAAQNAVAQQQALVLAQQNQTLILQNQMIIKLLQQIASK